VADKGIDAMADKTPLPPDANEQIRRRIEKLEGWRARGVHPFGGRFPVTHWGGELQARFKDAGEEALLGAKRYREARAQFDRVKQIGGAGPRDLGLPAARADCGGCCKRQPASFAPSASRRSEDNGLGSRRTGRWRTGMPRCSFGMRCPAPV
jgi:hypothetical protein